MIKKVQISLGIVLFLFLSIVLGNQFLSRNSNSSHLINCDIQSTSCTQSIADTIITLDIQPRPVRTMQDLTFNLKIQGPPLPNKPHIDLGMPGMDMGLNFVFLKALSLMEYEGKGILVKCPTGQTIWRVTVTLPEKGTVDFIFDVED